MRILIAGCGDLGTRLGSMLVSLGHEVWGLRRNAERLPSDLRPIGRDLTRDDLGDLPVVDVLYYTASAGERTPEAYRRAYVTGIQRLVAAYAHRSDRPRHLFYTSSTGVFHQSGGAWVDEDSPCEPTGFSGRTLLEGEEVIAGASIPGTVVRLSGIYGPGRHHLIRAVFGGASYPSDPPLFSNRIHVDDGAAFLAHLLTVNHPASRYLCSDGEPATMDEVANWMRAKMRTLGLSPRSESENPAPGRANRRVRTDRMRATGFRPRFANYREGYAALLTQWRPDRE
ncbi:SDR family oxidoreductase [Sulfidibacter corallicola]|uniref:SDR family oxidoreductase n=1 Tax=Sulfidibacter corallicola TaxID=2818388 RepID=A0A8A4TMU4_SULCO|nr:SDR family oxidoreductase [Sulfidibacter corallicola]QTD47915.1 SDR family oxidoreductase [Sulfidibacter corallicola]